MESEKRKGIMFIELLLVQWRLVWLLVWPVPSPVSSPYCEHGICDSTLGLSSHVWTSSDHRRPSCIWRECYLYGPGVGSGGVEAAEIGAFLIFFSGLCYVWLPVQTLETAPSTRWGRTKRRYSEMFSVSFLQKFLRNFYGLLHIYCLS